MSISISLERLFELFTAQARSSRLWIAEYQANGDLASIKEASFSIGKVFGIYGILITMGIEVPEVIIEEATELQTIWGNLEERK